MPQIVAAALLCSLLVCASLLIGQANSQAVVEVGWDNTFKYNPQTLTVAPGNTVTFMWPLSGTILHSVTSGDPSQCFPDGKFDSLGRLRGNYTHTFVLPGTYNYYCAPHCATGMQGQVIVNGLIGNTSVPLNTTPPTPQPTALPADFLAVGISFSSCPSPVDMETYLNALAAEMNISRSDIIVLQVCSGNSPEVITAIDPATYAPTSDLINAILILVSNGQVAPPPGQSVPTAAILNVVPNGSATVAGSLCALLFAVFLFLAH